MKLSTFLLAAALGTGLAAAASAQGLSAQQQAEFRRNCTADYTRLCADFQPDTPEVQQCFRQHMRELSPRCQTTIAAFSRGQRR